MKVLAIGDMHVKKDNLEESARLTDWIYSLAKEKDPDFIVFLGDQYDTMGIVRVEVIDFWTRAYNKLSEYPVISLIGNHDLNSEATASSMVSHHKATTVVKNTLMYSGNIGFMSFIRDNSQFEKAAMDLYNKGARLIFCHAEFNGAQFESGAYAPHGIDANLFPKDLKFVSGHFHKKQAFGNIQYLGTPRHLTRSDINEIKGVHIIDTNTLNMEFIATPQSVCQPFTFISINSEEDLKNIPTDISDFNKVYIDIKGTDELIKKAKKIVPIGAKIRVFEDQELIKTLEIKESEGIPTAFLKYSEKFFNTNSASKDTQEDVMNLVYKLCPSLKIGEK
jgi:DNA repair exonuclease SbcCD nuclease subunit